MNDNIRRCGWLKELYSCWRRLDKMCLSLIQILRLEGTPCHQVEVCHCGAGFELFFSSFVRCDRQSISCCLSNVGPLALSPTPCLSPWCHAPLPVGLNLELCTTMKHFLFKSCHHHGTSSQQQ